MNKTCGDCKYYDLNRYACYALPPSVITKIQIIRGNATSYTVDVRPSPEMTDIACSLFKEREKDENS